MLTVPGFHSYPLEGTFLNGKLSAELSRFLDLVSAYAFFSFENSYRLTYCGLGTIDKVTVDLSLWRVFYCHLLGLVIVLDTGLCFLSCS